MTARAKVAAPAARVSKNPLAFALLELSGQRNVITVKRAFVTFTGSLEAGMLLDQLLYWTPRSSMSGWIAKTDADFLEELCLTRYGIRAARKVLEEMGIIKTSVRKFHDTPTVHYLVLQDELSSQFAAFVALAAELRLSEIEQSDCPNPDNGLFENEQTLNTETTPETTPLNNKAAAPADALDVFTVYEHEVGLLTPFIADDVKAYEKEFGAEWLRQAIHIAAENNKRSWGYVKAVLHSAKEKGMSPALVKVQMAQPKSVRGKKKSDAGPSALERYARELGAI